jgi:hypothetical protein
MTTETVQQDWSAYEVAEEPKDSLQPEADALEIAEAGWTQPGARDKALESYRVRVEALVPTDDTSVRSCGEFVEQCKLAAKRVEEKRTALTEPLSKQVKDLNAVYMPVRDAFQNMAKAVTMRVNKFIDDRRRAAELEQQEINRKAAEKQALLDKQAQEARDKAAAEAAKGNDVKATILESKAMILEQKAAEVVPMQVAQTSSKIALEDSTVSFGGGKETWGLVGWADKKKPLRVNDPALAPLLGDVSKLPLGVQFILQHADLNPVHLNASYKGGMKFPAPFTTVKDYSKSTVR